MYDCKRATDKSIIAVGKWCVYLMAIDLGRCCMNITDDGLVAFDSGCSNVSTANLLDGDDICHLERICLVDCTNITDIGVSAIAPLLNTIKLIGCSLVSDIGVSAIGNNRPLLNIMNLAGCSLVSDIGVSAIGYNCPPLKTIDLSCSDIITDIGVSAIGNNWFL